MSSQLHRKKKSDSFSSHSMIIHCKKYLWNFKISFGFIVWSNSCSPFAHLHLHLILHANIQPQTSGVPFVNYPQRTETLVSLRLSLWRWRWYQLFKALFQCTMIDLHVIHTTSNCKSFNWNFYYTLRKCGLIALFNLDLEKQTNQWMDELILGQHGGCIIYIYICMYDDDVITSSFLAAKR